MSRQEGIRQLPRSQARCGFQHLAWDRGWDVAWSTPGDLSSSREVGGEAEAGRRRVTGVHQEHTPGLGRAKGPSTAPHTAELALPCCKGAGLSGPGLSGHRQPRPYEKPARICPRRRISIPAALLHILFCVWLFTHTHTQTHPHTPTGLLAPCPWASPLTQT